MFDDAAAVDLLRGLVERYSPSSQEAEAAGFLARAASDAGWDARVDEVGNFVAERRPGPPGESNQSDRSNRAGLHLVFLGHIDVAPGLVPVRLSEDALYGRGAVDAKGPLAAFVVAATRARLPEGLRVTAIGAVEEEAASSRGARHVIPLYRPDYLIIGEPSGWDTLCMGYRGRTRARVRIEQPQSHGASGHPSAGTLACRCWLAADQAARAHSRGGRLTERVSVEVADLNTDSDGLTETAQLELDVRTPPDFDGAVFRALLDEAAPDGARFEILEDLPAVRAPKTGPLVRALRAAIRAAGAEARFSFKSGTSDMNIAGPAWGCPMLAYGPGDSTLDHTPDEHIRIDEYLRSIQVLQRALEHLG